MNLLRERMEVRIDPPSAPALDWDEEPSHEEALAHHDKQVSIQRTLELVTLRDSLRRTHGSVLEWDDPKQAVANCADILKDWNS
jgi:hypothetical protein